MYFVDTHCHLNLMNSNGQLDFIIENAIKNNIKKIMVPGIDIETSLEAIKISEKYDCVYAAIGIHPNEANKWAEDSFTTLKELASHPKVRAIGEIGLDFYRKHTPREVQIRVLTEQLNLAEITGLPIIIHTRDSLQETLNHVLVWKNLITKRKIYGVFHSFEGNIEQAVKIASEQFFIGISGPITYKNASEKHELGKNFPLSSMLLETDSPYLSPHPLRGKPNEPANIKLIAEKISNLSEKPLKLVLQETTKNANILFAWEH